MKKILVYISPERYSSLFDLILGYDSGADIVVPYAETNDEEIRDVVYSCVYTRGANGRRNTAIFIGGPDVAKGEEFMDAVKDIFNELPPEFRVSVVADPHGAYTTSSACAVKIKNALGDVSGMNASVLAGTGPVGQSIAVLLAKQGCNVKITSRKLLKAQKTAAVLKDGYQVKVAGIEAKNPGEIEKAVSDADIVVAAGPERTTLLTKDAWSGNGRIKVLADVNAVPPYGIEGVDPRDDAKETGNVKTIGALTIGSLKIKCHHRMVERLFEECGQILDLEDIYSIAGSIKQ